VGDFPSVAMSNGEENARFIGNDAAGHTHGWNLHAGVTAKNDGTATYACTFDSGDLVTGHSIHCQSHYDY
jgi:hypothetical protein